jgi:serine phosphatase RsbU (regulator of sigma subunit)/Tfp pilus assembly protein PilF
MRYILLTLFLYTTTLFSHAYASNRLDSLQGIYSASKTDIERTDALINLYHYYNSINSDSALYFANSAFDLSEKIDYHEGKIKSMTNIGSVYFYKGEYGNALKCYLKSNEFVETYIQKNSKDDFAKNQLSKNLNNIALIYLNQGNYEEAENYLLESLAIDLDLKNPISIANCYNNLGALKERQDKYDEAIEYYTKAYDIKVSEKNEFEIPSTLINIGVVRMNQGAHYEADTCFRSAIVYSQKTKNSRDLCLAYINLGDLYYTQKKYDLSLTNYFFALDICEDNDFLSFLAYTYESISLVYFNMQKYKGAYEYYVLYSETKDKINSEENNKLINEIQTKYETEKKEREIAELSKEKVLQDIENENIRKFLIYSTIGLILISASLVLLFFSFKQKQRINAEIQIKNRKLEVAYAIVEDKNKEILDSINYAKRIQNAILPPAKLVKEYLNNSFILFKPKDVVAGDFYWLETYPKKQFGEDNILLFAVADCTGHGVPGAMVSVICNNGLNRSVREYGLTDPGDVLNRTRELVISEFEKSEEDVKDGMDIALVSMQKNDNKTSSISYSGANNALWIIRKNATEIEELKAQKQPIGKYNDPIPFVSKHVTLNEGDTIYLFSDGFADQFGGVNNKKFKSANFKKLLLNMQHISMERQKEEIEKTFENWRGEHEQLDDVCVMGVRV